MRNAVIIALALVAAVVAWFVLGSSNRDAGVHTERPIAAWIQQLDDGDVELRYQAGLMLAKYGEAAVPALIARLTRDIGKPQAERGDPDAEGEPRHIAADTLVMIGEPATGPLIEALAAATHYERALAQQALVAIGVGRKHLGALTRLLGHDNAIAAGMAGHLISELEGGRDALLLVLETNADDETSVHRALLTLGRIDGDKPATMTPFLSHPSPIVRREALHVLRLVGAAPSQAETIAALLGDPDEQVRSWAATVLRRMKLDALFALVAAARDSSPTPAQLAVSLIGELGTDALSAVPVLRTRMEDPLPVLRAAAAEALHTITRVEDDALPVLLDVVESAQTEGRILAIAALGGFEESAERLTEVLRPLLKDADLEVARVAAVSLGNLGPRAKAALDDLEEAAASPSQALSRAASIAVQLIRGVDGD